MTVPGKGSFCSTEGRSDSFSRMFKPLSCIHRTCRASFLSRLLDSDENLRVVGKAMEAKLSLIGFLWCNEPIVELHVNLRVTAVRRDDGVHRIMSKVSKIRSPGE